ncbi:MAG: protein TonB [Halieaceae bacterium]|jgi:protein TonB
MNNWSRMIIGALLAIPVAGGLFFIMQYLIASAQPDIDDSKQLKVADIVMPETEIDTNIAEKKPDKPDDPEEPPPDLDSPQLDMDMSMETINIAPIAAVDISIGGASGLGASDGEYLPIVKVAPIYPRRAQSRGLEGFCIIEYTVTKTGAIRDPFVVENACDSVFASASLKASMKFKYKPRVVDGEPIEVGGVQNKFTYELEK